MHIVSFNRHLYPDVSTAITKPGGLAVLGVLFKVETKGVLLKSMGTFMEALQFVRMPQSEVTITAFKPDGLLTGHTDLFYRYQGSLTTPPCTENVVWTVLKDKLPVTDKQVAVWFYFWRNFRWSCLKPSNIQAMRSKRLWMEIIVQHCRWIRSESRYHVCFTNLEDADRVIDSCTQFFKHLLL